MIRVLFVIAFLIQTVLPSENLFLIDSLDSDIQLLLDYDKKSKKIKSKEAQVNFFSETSFLIYDKTCPGSKSYFSFTDEFINQEKQFESAA